MGHAGVNVNGRTNEGGLEMALGVLSIGLDGLEVIHGADAGLAVEEIVHLDVQAGQGGADRVVPVARLELPPVGCTLKGQSSSFGAALMPAADVHCVYEEKYCIAGKLGMTSPCAISSHMQAGILVGSIKARHKVEGSGRLDIGACGIQAHTPKSVQSKAIREYETVHLGA